MQKTTGSYSAVRYQPGEALNTQETLIAEEALQICLNGEAYTITMRTPGRDLQLAMGLLLTEGLIQNRKAVVAWQESETAFGINLEVPAPILAGKNLNNRSLVSSASCGVCGKTDLSDLFEANPALDSDRILDINVIGNALKSMASRQEAFAHTGGCHGAAAFSLQGELLAIEEDIGRHNAVDKVVGNLLLRDILNQAAILLVSGRVSHEIASKCLRARIPFLCAVSAPSSLAVEFCQEKGITLACFCRDGRATVYSHIERIQPV